MSRLRIALSALFLMALTAVWGYLFMNTRAVDSARQNQILGLVTQLKQLDAEWNVDVLKSQIELNKNYDPLVRPVGRMTAIVEQLNAEASASGPATATGGGEALKALGALKEAMAGKTALIDRFKTQNAVIKNSLRYLPTAHVEIQELLGKEHAAAPAPASKRPSPELAIGNLVGEILKYNAAPDADSAQAARASAALARESAQSAPASIHEAVENLLTHAEIVLHRSLLHQVHG